MRKHGRFCQELLKPRSVAFIRYVTDKLSWEDEPGNKVREDEPGNKVREDEPGNKLWGRGAWEQG